MKPLRIPGATAKRVGYVMKSRASVYALSKGGLMDVSATAWRVRSEGEGGCVRARDKREREREGDAHTHTHKRERETEWLSVQKCSPYIFLWPPYILYRNQQPIRRV